MSTAAWLYQHITGQPHPALAVVYEHPVRCAASAPAPLHPTAHIHRCVLTAKPARGVSGLLEHYCDCGATWTEPTRPAAVATVYLQRGDLIHMAIPKYTSEGTMSIAADLGEQYAKQGVTVAEWFAADIPVPTVIAVFRNPTTTKE